MQLFVQRVHLLVAGNDRTSPGRVALDESIDGAMKHFESHLGHARDIDVRLERRFLVQFEGAAADGGGLVTDPFQIVRDFHRDGDQAQIGSQRRF